MAEGRTAAAAKFSENLILKCPALNRAFFVAEYYNFNFLAAAMKNTK